MSLSVCALCLCPGPCPVPCLCLSCSVFCAVPLFSPGRPTRVPRLAAAAAAQHARLRARPRWADRLQNKIEVDRPHWVDRPKLRRGRSSQNKTGSIVAKRKQGRSSQIWVTRRGRKKWGANGRETIANAAGERGEGRETEEKRAGVERMLS